ncbi:MAG: hypothetical protein JW709_06595 [Sedimentisphaerales bacterium]|nr:hypothetical protein [Sedimentisphaerales bacterium]
MGFHVQCFAAPCPHCHVVAAIPLLSDFAYGEFIYQTDDGHHFAYAMVIAEPAWDRVDAILREHAGMGPHKNDVEIDVFQHIIIRCADLFNGRPFTTDFPLCPHCGGKITSYSDKNRLYSLYIHDVTWSTFMALPPTDQVKTVMELLEQEKS